MTSRRYSGNPNLRRANERVRLTAEQLQEYIHCAKNKIDFFKKFVYIVTLDHGRRRFIPYDYQIEISREIDKHRFLICLLPRQMGKTTIIAAEALHAVVFKPDYAVAILANRGRTARLVLERIRQMFELLPDWIKPGVIEWNKGSIRFENGSSITADTTSSSAIRGESINMLILDEFAHVQGQDQFWTSTYPVVSAGQDTKVIIISTPNGLDLFYRIFSDAQQEKNEFKSIYIPWQRHPERDQKWYETTISNIGPERFRQEYNCEFIGSEHTLIPGETLREMAPQTPIMVDYNGVRYFDKLSENKYYLVGVDTARGIGNDCSAFSVIEYTADGRMVQVAAFDSPEVNPAQFANILRETLEGLECRVIIETNDLGQQTLHELGYGEGQATSAATKRRGALYLRRLLQDRVLQIRDEKTISELYTFVRKGSSYQSQSQRNRDDLVMSLIVLSAWLALPTNKEETDSLRDSVGKSTQDNLIYIPQINNDELEELKAELVGSGLYLYLR